MDGWPSYWFCSKVCDTWLCPAVLHYIYIWVVPNLEKRLGCVLSCLCDWCTLKTTSGSSDSCPTTGFKTLPVYGKLIMMANGLKSRVYHVRQHHCMLLRELRFHNAGHSIKCYTKCPMNECINECFNICCYYSMFALKINSIYIHHVNMIFFCLVLVWFLF